MIYEAPTHVSNAHAYDAGCYQGARKNPMANLIMFLVLIAILVFGFMAITHTSFDQLIHILSGNHTVVTIKTQ